MSKINEMVEYIELLNKASEKYYNGENSDVSDKQWDIWFDKLKMLEESTGTILSGSPTQKVGYEVKSKLEKVTHTSPMLSLDKTKEPSQLIKFLGNEEGVLSWKEDGLTLVLTYEGQKLISAVTRGNGEVGSNVLHNAKVFKSGIPLTINYNGRLVVRGEGMISKKDFDMLNVTGEYANPRNLSSGSIMQLDNKIAKERKLQFKAFAITECEREFNLYSDQLDWLGELGFNPVEYTTVNKLNLEEAIQEFKLNIEDYDYATDGLVLRFNNIKYGEKLGSTNHHELSAQAFKWFDITEQSVLRSIQFQVGRTGVLTPVANFDEINLENSMVSKASLHNISILRALELGIGDTITVHKCNMIIPQLDDNLTRSNTFILPTQCPSCGGSVEIIKANDTEVLMCCNPNCGAKLVQKISHYCSRNALNMLGISDAIIESLIEEGFITDIPDLYDLEKYKDKIVKMSGFGLKSYNKIIESVNNSKKVKMSNFLFGLGISQIGVGGSKIIAKYFNNNISEFIDAIRNDFDFTKLSDVGQKTSDAIKEWFDNTDNENMFYSLLDYIEFEKEEVKIMNENSTIQGKTFVVTGDVFHFKNRKELEAKILSLGAKLTGSVSKNTDFLLNNDLDSPTTKNQKAKSLNIPIINENTFLQMIGE